MRHNSAEHGVKFNASQNITFDNRGWKLNDPIKVNWEEFLKNEKCVNCTIFGQFGEPGFPEPQNVFDEKEDEFLALLAKIHFHLKANLVTSHNGLGLAPHVHFNSHLMLFEGVKEWHLSRPVFFFKVLLFF